MTAIDYYQLDDAGLQRVANQVLGVCIDSLRKEGKIDQALADDVHTNYSIIIEKNTWLPEFLSKWMGFKEGRAVFRLVRAVGREKASE